MAGITLEQAQTKLDAYLAAEEKILLGQKAVISGKELTRANLKDVQEGVKLWNARVIRLSRTGGMSVREVIPR